MDRMTAIRSDEPTTAALRADVAALTERVAELELDNTYRLDRLEAVVNGDVRAQAEIREGFRGIFRPTPPPAPVPVTQASRDDLDGMPMWKPVKPAPAPDEDYPTREEVAEWDAVYRGDPAPADRADYPSPEALALRNAAVRMIESCERMGGVFKFRYGPLNDAVIAFDESVWGDRTAQAGADTTGEG